MLNFTAPQRHFPVYGADILVQISVTFSYFVVISVARFVLIIEYYIYTSCQHPGLNRPTTLGGVYAAGMRRDLPKL